MQWVDYLHAREEEGIICAACSELSSDVVPEDRRCQG